MMEAFPSSQSKITPGVVEAYSMAIARFDLNAVQAACQAFICGTVQGRNNSFAPSAPELADEVQRQQDRLRWEAHAATHDFVVEGSDEWRQIVALRGSTPPTREINGVKGWDIPKGELSQARQIELPKPRDLSALPAPNLRRAS